ncbi:hypothetical protein C0L75_03070 [Clostridium perfringens]
MSKRSRKNFNIGDTFLTWKVIKCVDSKKYRFLCRCSCGNEKVFYKYNLLRNSFSCCKECNNFTPPNLSILKNFWNYELNGSLTSKIQNVNFNQPYWFICEKGHNFKSSIKDFSLSKCKSCSCNLKSDKFRIEMMEYAFSFLSEIIPKQHLEKTNDLIYIHPLKLTLSFLESDRFTTYRNYYSNEKEFLDHCTLLKKLELESYQKAYKFTTLEVKENFKSNVDTITNLVLSLFM